MVYAMYTISASEVVLRSGEIRIGVDGRCLLWKRGRTTQDTSVNRVLNQWTTITSASPHPSPLDVLT
jgi:hypothetical protein